MLAVIPKFPLAQGIDVMLDWLTAHIAVATRSFSDIISIFIHAAVHALLWLPPWLLIGIVALAIWRMATWRMALGSALGLLLLWNLRMWSATVETFTLVLISTLLAVIIGLPMGVLTALSKRVARVVMPILDVMQTMPAFVYLIPSISFFGLGNVSASVATVIFATPPTIRLTALGIRQVPTDLIEAADAFGSTRWQKLIKVQLPMSIPTIMAGINQTIMLSLSMVVIAAMIGAGGLGGLVWEAIQRLQPGKGFEAGIAIVILAVILDRTTQRIGRPTHGK